MEKATTTHLIAKKFGSRLLIPHLYIKIRTMLYYSHENAVSADDRYSNVKYDIDAGRITCLEEIFRRIPKTVVANALGKKVDRFTVMVQTPDHFRLSDVRKMSILFGVSYLKMFTIIINRISTMQVEPFKQEG